MLSYIQHFVYFVPFCSYVVMSYEIANVFMPLFQCLTEVLNCIAVSFPFKKLLIRE